MKVILTYSGGLDSTVLLYHLLKNLKCEVRCLSVHYGQKHKKELISASLICKHLKVEHQVADLSHLKVLFAGSSQTSNEVQVPEGHYAEESMKATVVPNRNAVLLSLAGAWAVATKSNAVAYAAHAGDHTIYPDCRKEFADAMGVALSLCDWHKIELLRPFVDKTKAGIVKLGADLKVPFEWTWSCYKGKELHCGKCGTCVERCCAFKQAGVNDLTEYEDKDYAHQFKE